MKKIKLRLHYRKRLRGIPIRNNIPNMITSGNLLCGMLSLILTVRGHYLPAAWMIPCAVFFDFMDGKVARAMGVSSDFGVEFDSLGDVVSFGVAPAVLVYSTSLQALPGVVGALIAAFFALCGALRLARFNIVHRPGPFQGLPIPAGGLFLVSIVLAGLIGKVPAWLMGILTAVDGFLMISSVPYGNLKAIKKGFMNKAKLYGLAAFAAVVFIAARQRGLLILISIYLVSGIVRFDWGTWLSLPEPQQEERNGSA
ncbi:CDP-diacylglycerol--serine O-phosphatidyltransferase [Pyramidobacter piscolens]|uniref:CDP-diacylglycerol--serine O-phosphatidyltransferase n=1 Tax=Pyramidobacter piscolens W5455 TaxID=352165 RepID=A0ABP2HRB4_9BACT|nr:CDP-diacylglycerol--serine O-phosphatidyltransferase [Pyramidobacter piscolens]EFB89894.1 CDP-diacylglycerol-serine O-phosphatidyltransferase [Pyramidobacter piscolens W5455]BDF78147.1 CDP-diacylglycerol--serine O-phosphatidyltransferase [Pyramidobacter piscolens]